MAEKHLKMLNTQSHQWKANQNLTEIRMSKIKTQVTADMDKGTLPPLGVGLQAGATTLDIILEIP